MNLNKKLIGEIEKTRERLEKDLGREPLIEEIAVEIGEDPSYINAHLGFKVEEVKKDTDFRLRFRLTIKNHELEKRRLEIGLTQKKLAKKLKIGWMTYNSIETCRSFPSRERIENICKFIGISENIIFPEWLKMFSDKWKKAEKSRIVPVSTLSLGSPEVMLLESGDQEEMFRNAQSAIIRREFEKVNLSERERDILEMINDEKLVSDIAKKYGITSARVNQIKEYALDKVRNSEYFKNYYQEICQK